MYCVTAAVSWLSNQSWSCLILQSTECIFCDCQTHLFGMTLTLICNTVQSFKTYLLLVVRSLYAMPVDMFVLLLLTTGTCIEVPPAGPVICTTGPVCFQALVSFAVICTYVSTLCLKKRAQLWNGIARNYMDRFWWYLAEIFKSL